MYIMYSNLLDSLYRLYKLYSNMIYKMYSKIIYELIDKYLAI